MFDLGFCWQFYLSSTWRITSAVYDIALIDHRRDHSDAGSPLITAAVPPMGYDGRGWEALLLLRHAGPLMDILLGNALSDPLPSAGSVEIYQIAGSDRLKDNPIL